MGFSRTDLVFVLIGGALGAIVAFALKSGWFGLQPVLPPFVFVLLGLGLVELAAGFAMGRAPGGLIGMPGRFTAFVVGVGVLALLNGGLG